MNGLLPFLSFWGHAAVAFSYVAAAVWILHRYGWTNSRQVALTGALGVTAIWGLVSTIGTPATTGALTAETVRNFAWLAFMLVLLHSGEGHKQPRSINMIYAVLFLVLLCQPVMDALAIAMPNTHVGDITLQTAILLRMIYGIGALVLVHNLYTVSAPDARWGVALPMAALAAMWTFDLNLYTIAYLTSTIPVELVSMRGFAMTLLAPIFVLASHRNSAWRLRLSRSVAFQSASLLAIGVYLFGMLMLATAVEFVGGSYTRLAQITLIFGMTLGALLILPSGKFRAWVNVTIAKHFFQHRYDYRNEWMRFADTIGFPSQDAAPFNERVIKSLADIFDSPAGLLIVPDADGRLALQARWNWATAEVPEHVGTSHTVPFFESTGHILSMDELRDGKDNRCDPRAVPQWLFDEDQAWAVVPLVHFGKLAGLAVLARPRLPRPLDWEDLDMLRTVGRQLASYLAEASSQQELSEARQFEQFNRRFAFVMHDIKNLVSQLSILARNAEKHGGNPDFQADMLDTLRGSVGKMNDLLARLSQHNKARHAAPEPVDIAVELQKALQGKVMTRPIDTDLPVGLFALADTVRLETIVNHLVQNAIDASEPASPVKVSATRRGEDVAVMVADQGCGMSEAFIADQLFKPFESTKEGGFGIGAYEARQLAQSMGGQLRVESRLGSGTTFTLLLPAAEAPAQQKFIEKAA